MFLINKIALFFSNKKANLEILNKIVLKYKTVDTFVAQFKTEYQVIKLNKFIKNDFD